MLDVADIDLLQFQGDESPEFCGQFELPYMKGIRMSAETSVAELVERYENAWAFQILIEGLPAAPAGGSTWTSGRICPTYVWCLQEG